MFTDTTQPRRPTYDANQARRSQCVGGREWRTCCMCCSGQTAGGDAGRNTVYIQNEKVRQAPFKLVRQQIDQPFAYLQGKIKGG